MINRRQFLGALGAAAAGAQTGRRVLIAGAGIAGLCCAYELGRRGYDVTVLEGRSRPGGRVEILREGLAPGLTAETGATRIPDTHHLTLDYVREFDLPLEPFHPQGSLDTFHVRGRNYTMAGATEPGWPLDLTAQEREFGRNGLISRHLLPRFATPGRTPGRLRSRPRWLPLTAARSRHTFLRRDSPREPSNWLHWGSARPSAPAG